MIFYLIYSCEAGISGTPLLLRKLKLSDYQSFSDNITQEKSSKSHIWIQLFWFPTF